MSRIEDTKANSQIEVDLALYGSIARFAGGRHISRVTVALPAGSTMQDLFERYGLPAAERGYVFCNAVLYDMPGLNVAGAERLVDGDHVGIFGADRAWPYQYRQGVRMTKTLAAALREHGELRHSHRQGANES